MKAAYFWVSGRLLVKDHYISAEDARIQGVCELPCVDAFQETPEQRYGVYTRSRGWEHIPIEQFPKAFRLELLLLGVA